MKKIKEFISCVNRVLVWPMIGWVLFLSPVIMILAAIVVPNMLSGLVLLRTEESTSGYIWDVVCLTAAAMLTSALGVSVIRLFDLYALLQFGSEKEPHPIHSPAEMRTVDVYWWSSRATAWPVAFVIAWGCISISYPIFSYLVTNNNINEISRSINVEAFLGASSNDGAPVIRVSGLVLGLSLGALVALLFLLAISLIHLLMTRRKRSACGLLPMEDIAAVILEKLIGKVRAESVQEAPSSQLPVNPHILKKLLRWLLGPGFLHPVTFAWLPGHLQMVSFMTFAFLAYSWLWFIGFDQLDWIASTFHVGVYALLLLFLVGGLVGVVTFVFGRIRLQTASLLFISLTLGIVVYTTHHYGWTLGFDTNCYFTIVEPSTKTTPAQELGPLREDDGAFIQITKRYKQSNNNVRTALAGSSADRSKTGERKRLKEIYSNWNFPKGPDGKRTMIVVTASGGGIQASAWTAKVLTGLDEEFPLLSESIGLVSGVSGGSVGAMYYLGHRGFRRNLREYQTDKYDGLSIPTNIRHRIQTVASASSLESIGFGLAFVDIAKFIPPLCLGISKEEDRGLTLESQWWTRMSGDQLSESNNDQKQAQKQTLAMKDLRMRDLFQPTNEGLLPAVIFNATTVETGQRVMISNFITDPFNPIKKTESSVQYERLSSPIDFFGFYEPLFENPGDVNPRVSTAVRLSASFAYVTPVARPLLPTSGLKTQIDELTMRRANFHLCDGGYSENTGIVATIRVVKDLLDDYKTAGEKPPFERVLFISIESFPDNLVEIEDDPTGLKSGLIGPLSSIFASRVASQAERSILELELLKSSEQLEFSERLDSEIMAVFEIESFEKYRSDAAALVSKISDSTLDEDKKDDLINLVQPISRMELRTAGNSGKIPLSQATSIRNSASDFLKQKETFQQDWGAVLGTEQQSLDSLVEQAKKFSQIDLPEQSVTAASQDSSFEISIAALQFRFNPGFHQARTMAEAKMAKVDSEKAQIETPKMDKKVPNPPLSWMLSPYDKHRLELAWQNELKRIRGSSVASAGSDEPVENSKLTSPSSLQNMLQSAPQTK